MATKMRIEYISEGFREVLMGDGVSGLVSSTTNRLAAKAGDGFKAVTFIGGFGGGRPVGVVRADTYDAKRRQATDKVLQRVING